jgi:hypothetical protein
MKPMNTLLPAMACLTLGTTLLTACFNDDTTTTAEVSTDCVVTSFGLGNLQRTLHVRTTDGKKDSSYVQNIAGINYAFTIDQERNTIYNQDSLPHGTSLSSVKPQTFTVSGVARLVSLLNQSDTVFSTTTAVDLTKTRTLHVYGLDGVSRRNYTLEVRVHREEGDSVTWTQPTEAAWTAQGFTFPAAGTWQGEGRLFRVQGTAVFTSTDGTTWTKDSVDGTDAAYLPDANIAGTVLAARDVNHLQEWVMCGTKNGTVRVWTRKWDTSGTYQFRWELMPPPTTSGYTAPVLENPQMLPYDGGVLLVGRTTAGTPVLRYSRDRGRTWVSHPTLALPANFPKTVSRMQAAVDARGQLWIHTDNGVWRARLHRLSWNTTSTTF